MSERIQQLIHSLEVGGGARWLRHALLAAAVAGLVVLYDLNAYRGFCAPEAMDAAQVARNLADGRGYATDFIRPFSVWLVQNHNQKKLSGEMLSTNVPDSAQINGAHPDLANPPLYPTVLAGILKLSGPDRDVETNRPFWSAGGRFQRHRPEFFIALFNQLLLLAAVALTFFIAKKILDAPAAWLAAGLTLGAETLWKFSVSGQSTLLLLLIFLGAIGCLIEIEELGRAVPAPAKKLFILAATAGLLIGAGMLTRYSFGWLILPTAGFIALFGGARGKHLAAATGITFILVVTPWIVRNLMVSGTLFGTAGYAVVEGTYVFPGARLMQSLNPDLTPAHAIRPYVHKLFDNLRAILQGDLLRLAGGWAMVLFLAGLLLGLRSPAARRLRYFTVACLALLAVVQALGKTSLSTVTPEINSENLLVLLTPLVAIFGVVFFLTLVGQMRTPSSKIRYAVIALLVALCCQPLLAALLPPKISPVCYPPYYPPEIEKISGWMKPGECMMSDVPWAVAWYGRRQCVWNTTDARTEFFQFNDNVKQVRALYLSLNVLDEKLFTECLQGGADSWGNLVFRTIAGNQVPASFPLRAAPRGLTTGVFFTDYQRWDGQ
jgi:hypothetical protein